MNLFLRSALMLAMCSTGALAQLKQGSLSIKGGESYTIGQKVMVTFVQTGPGTGADAGKYDFYLSTNGGGRFVEFVAKFAGPTGSNDTVKYEWTVPNSPTTTAQWRACLLGGGHCSPAQYVLTSPNFTITAATPVLPRAPETAGKLEFDASTGSLAFGFSLASPGRVTLQAFDAQGKLMETLLDEEKAAGDFSLSIASDRLHSLHGAVAFKLDWGAASLVRSLVLP